MKADKTEPRKKDWFLGCSREQWEHFVEKFERLDLSETFDLDAIRKEKFASFLKLCRVRRGKLHSAKGRKGLHVESLPVKNGTTPAVAAGVELEPLSLERVVEITDQYLRRQEDAKFEQAFAAAGI